jgi:menaquinone-dependent protoporphyrinogen IX oxidase
MKILVTYATSRGSTKSIAERIQQRLALANVGDVTIEDVEKKPVIADFGPYKNSLV